MTCYMVNEVIVRLNDGRQVIVNTVNDNLLVHQCDTINLQCIHHPFTAQAMVKGVVAMNHSNASLGTYHFNVE